MFSNEMKRLLLPLLVVSAIMLQGCDMFRKLAGRPTGEEVELMRIEKLKAEERMHQARIDSMKKVQQQLADSLAVMDSLMQNKGTILNPSDVGGLFTTKLDARYYVVVGAFKSRSNAESLLETVSDKGYNPILISFRNGFNAIAMFPANNVVDAFANMKKVKAEPFCPDDVWILVNE